MKTITFPILVSLFFIPFCFFSCEDSPSSIAKDKLALKHEPSDAFFMQRLDAAGNFSIEAYHDALKEIQTDRQRVQSRAINGFDRAWETQGPGNIGARINTIAVHPVDENIIYTGFSNGGVFKTVDGGENWQAIFDDQISMSIGDIAIDPNNPDIIYVGTGDPNITGFPFIGDGLYRSEDAGNTWTHLGLTEQRIVSEIIIDYTAPNRIFAACMGLPFERNNDRGLYRSIDNGNSWEQVLFLSDSTGVIDIAMHPTNPQILYAAGWDRIRNNFESIATGYGAKIYKSMNGGDTWTLIEGGLPNEMPNGRIGLSMHAANPDIVYAEYVGLDHRLKGIYRTNNAGESWYPIELSEELREDALGGFGWYFGTIRVNPNNPDDLYVLGISLWRSENGGQNWNIVTPPWWDYVVHADAHDLTFLDDGGVLLATDGGLYRSDSSNVNWLDIENIPATQFYRVAYNPHRPDNYYGGAQDNGTTGGNKEAIDNWPRIYGGDGFQMTFDWTDEDRFFVETQRGNIYVTLNGGNDYNWISGGIAGNESRNWDMPYILSPHDPYTLFTGGERLYKGTGAVPELEAISEDLTDGPDGLTRNGTISTIDESPIEQGLLYVGTGDGNIWRGNSEGTAWTNISNGLPDQYVTDIVASPSDADVVYVSYSGYRDNDFVPRIYRSADRGETWESISNDLPDIAINDLLITPFDLDSIIFVATDGGVYGSITSGQEWERLGSNMPIVPVYHLAFNERNNELVAGTFARSILSYPLDSIRSLENLPVSTSTPIEAIASGLTIRPSLARNTIQVDIENTENGRKVAFVIIGLDGKLLYQSEPLAGDHITAQVDISHYPAGQYFVKAKMRHKVVSSAFIKQ